MYFVLLLTRVKKILILISRGGIFTFFLNNINNKDEIKRDVFSKKLFDIFYEGIES